MRVPRRSFELSFLVKSLSVASAALFLLIACGKSGSSSSAAGTSAAAAPATVSATPITGAPAPEVTQVETPKTFRCLPEYTDQAQVTIGFSSPNATAVTFTLDGKTLPVGIKDTAPFEVPANGPTGIGATIVFACSAGKNHTIEGSWVTGDSPATTRTFTVKKEAYPK
jgi:hypothetical protein